MLKLINSSSKMLKKIFTPNMYIFSYRKCEKNIFTSLRCKIKHFLSLDLPSPPPTPVYLIVAPLQRLRNRRGLGACVLSPFLKPKIFKVPFFILNFPWTWCPQAPVPPTFRCAPLPLPPYLASNAQKIINQCPYRCSPPPPPS